VLDLGSLAFAAPWILLAGIVLPLLWWLLRLMPPAPRSISFPAIRLLYELHPREETPARTPWWLLLLRLAAAALVILGLAQPLLNPGERLTGSGPLLLVVDNGWASARHWQARVDALDDLIDRAERQDRPVIVLATAPPVDDGPVRASGLLSAADARRLVLGLEPLPWGTDRRAALTALDTVAVDGSATVVWLSDGLDGDGAADLARRLQRLGALSVLEDAPTQSAHLLVPPGHAVGSLTVTVRRPEAGDEDAVVLVATGDDGRLVDRVDARIEAGRTDASATFDLPAEMRNRLAQIAIEGETSAGAVVLLDERWRRRPVGLVDTSARDEVQPLLSEFHYIEQALDPYVDLRRGSVDTLLQRDLAVLIVADAAILDQPARDRIDAWVRDGGTLLRFAGPHLAQQTNDDLLPVQLRQGGRTLGGAMSWSKPARLAPFEPRSPFYGIPLPNDVTIQQQVLAQPVLDLSERTWARLEDGTPLVTAAQHGDGWLVLVHTTANTNWSNLAISGLFVDMLRAVVAHSQGVAGAAEEDKALAPWKTLDGTGRLRAPPVAARPLDTETLESGAIGPRHPPGLYGDDSGRRAYNLAAGVPVLRPLPALPAGVERHVYASGTETDLTGLCLAIALALVLFDLAIVLVLRGLLRPAVARGTAAALFALLIGSVMAVWPGGAHAQDAAASAADAFALRASLETRLAYVETGVPDLDRISEAGLAGLSQVLTQRTAVEAAAPMGVDLAADELAFFSLLYWPISDQQATPSPMAIRHLNEYIQHGGTLVIDTRDGQRPSGFGFGAQASQTGTTLQRLTQGLVVPPLMPMPPDHVLTRSFYLLQEFPGRWTGGEVWVAEVDERINDGVPSVIVGSADWAAAWAVDSASRPMFAVVPGGEPQRELAYRFGINLVMHVLTGNYKADQVHVPAILERLGQ
jgi:hypothetical protein